MSRPALRQSIDNAEYELWAYEQYQSAVLKHLRTLIKQTPAHGLARLQREGKRSDKAAVVRLEQRLAHLVDFVYPRYFLSPLVLLLCAVFEGIVTECAEELRTLKRIDLRLVHLRGGLFTRLDRYYTSVLRCPLDTRSNSWDSIKAMFEFRHCLIHANGIVRPGEATKITSLLSTYNGAKVEHNAIVFAPDFFDEATPPVLKWLRAHIEAHK